MAAVAILPIAIGWPQLPGPVATHWGVDGQPDGATSKSWLWVLPLALVILGLLVSLQMRRDGRPSAESCGLVGLLGGIPKGHSSSSTGCDSVGRHISESRSSDPNSEIVFPTAAAKALPASLRRCLTSGSCRAADTEPATWFQAEARVPKASFISCSEGPFSLAARW